ncbi:MAG: hypothetical protein GF401_02325 [Chitinivibrionales bacterium]|nr:hypothetical protein [Chitinivibrionales bacterium]
MKIACSIEESRIATVFDFSDKLLVADVCDGANIHKEIVSLPCTLASIRVGSMRDMQIETLICGAVSNPLAAMIWHAGITLVAGITGDTDQVMDAWLNGKLQDTPRFLLPGSGLKGRCGWGLGRCGRMRRGRGWGGRDPLLRQ